ncbi:hypothetical protein Cri9333_2754 [Crinalium epipsammum PCC 9333]|uniref:Uncharacterized protein n=1 Tax=Crinalium epipsammum PCC 9333 TaxID=1173022 RepID=K9W1D7_9CYAN|nr:hypothetical protein [Crinalium epipsammum]AFZ13604.1 hypothetical protein Cri9333_2754 [Crinalium epipsammum PCC 9333]
MSSPDFAQEFFHTVVEDCLVKLDYADLCTLKNHIEQASQQKIADSELAYRASLIAASELLASKL